MKSDARLVGSRQKHSIKPKTSKHEKAKMMTGEGMRARRSGDAPYIPFVEQ